MPSCMHELTVNSLEANHAACGVKVEVCGAYTFPGPVMRVHVHTAKGLKSTCKLHLYLSAHILFSNIQHTIQHTIYLQCSCELGTVLACGCFPILHGLTLLYLVSGVWEGYALLDLIIGSDTTPARKEWESN